MKTNKSLLVKFLTVLCALCLSLSVAFGLVACGEEVRSIIKTEIKNGELIVTYSDNTSENLGVVVGKDGANGADFVGLADKCNAGAEHKAVTHTVKYANCKEGGLDLVVCDVCKGFKVVETAKNPELHGTYTKKVVGGEETLVFTSFETAGGEYVAATCTTDGKNQTVCAGCNVELANEKINKFNHQKLKEGTTDEYVSAYVYVEGAMLEGNSCIDGTFDGNVCTLCGHVKDAKYYPNLKGHHTVDSSWVEIETPTKEKAGAIKGICADCNTEQTIVLPKLNDTDYAHYVPTCETVKAGQSDKESYTFNKYGYNKSYEFEYVITHMKRVGGAEVPFVEEGTYEYSKLGLTKDDFSGEIIPDCSTAKPAWVVCDDCGVKYTIKATGEHAIPAVADKNAAGEIIKKDPTCTEDGWSAQYTCTACNDYTVYDEVDALGHSLELNGVFTKNGENETAPVKCTECDYTATITGTIHEEGEASCKAKAFKNIKYTLDGTTYLYTGKIEYGELESHYVTVGGVNVPFVEEGTYEYSALGLTEDNFTGETIPDCSTAKSAWVICDGECGARYSIKATGKHTIPDEADKDANGAIIKKDPTCTGKGWTAQYTCTACNDYTVYDYVNALGHKNVKDGDYIYGENDNVTIPVICEVCSTESTITGKITDRKDTATCTERAYKEITYIDSTGSHVDKVYEGYLAPHFVVVGSTNVNFVEEGTYEYQYLGLTKDNFTGEAIPDCSTAKSAWVECAGCHIRYSIKATGEHKYNAEPDKDENGNVIVKEATCTTAGHSAQYSCKACDYVRVDQENVIPAKGHTWSAKVEAGKVNLTCACGATASGTIVKWSTVDGVDYKDGENFILDYAKIVKLASKCGEKVTIVCSYKESADATVVKTANVVLEALEHDFAEGNVIEFELEIGDKVYLCKAYECKNQCGKYYIFEQVEKTA